MILNIPWVKRMTRIIIPIQKSSIISGFLLPFTAALPCFAIPLAWKLLLKALHRADDQFSSMGPGYFLQCWQEARTGFDRYFYDVWDRYYARLRSCLGPAPSRWAVCALRPRCCF